LFLAWYDYRIHRGVAQVAREVGWHLICPKSKEDRNRIKGGWQGDGCISLLERQEDLQNFCNGGPPAVDLGLLGHSLPVSRIATDNSAIGQLAVQHFLDRGYREIFMASHQNIPMFKERFEAVRVGMEAKGGKVTLLKSSGETWAGVLDQLQGIAKSRNSSIEELSIAFFAYEDYRAAELISLCLEKGLRVPENLAVLGVDNDDLINDGLAIGLSSVDSDQEGLGRKAALLLQKRMENPGETIDREILRHPPKGIITRNSTDGFAVRSPLVSKALYWIHGNYQLGIQAVDVAKAMEVTQQSLQKAFICHHRRSPGEEIRFQRVHAAAHMLRHSPATLVDIAEKCSFYTVDALITNFKKTFGVTPGQYRKQQLP